MKKNTLKIINMVLLVAIVAYIPVTISKAEVLEKKLENVFFEKLPGKERINLVVSAQPVIKAEGQTNGSLLVKLEDTTTPEGLQQSLGEGQLNNILRVTPSERKINGKQWTYLMIDIRELAPYSIKQEGKNVLIDFNIKGLPERKSPPAPVVAASPEKTDEDMKDIEKKKEAEKRLSAAAEAATKPLPAIKPRYTERKISVDFQDADIKSVFRLLSEYGNVSIVSGDDVKGTVTLSMKNVPWEQALDTILDVNGLAKKEMGNVISVLTLERKKKQEETRRKAEEEQFSAEMKRRDREAKMLAAAGKLRQILIEAKIVEATDEFTRNLGVQWGFGGQQHIGSYGSAISGGTNTIQTNSWRYGYPSEITLTDSLGNPLYMAAVNLASAFTGPTLGFVIGKGSAFLEAQLAALERTTAGKIISSPKVVTMDDVKATIKQGEEVPYIIETTAGGVVTRTVAFKEALLKLEVRPKITDDGKISMEITASNDRADYTNVVLNNPPIKKNEVESTVVVNDGDTVVIGGVSIDTDEKVDEGIPWFHRIPILGYLFKAEELTHDRKQLLVFITPKILKRDSFAESDEKIIN